MDDPPLPPRRPDMTLARPELFNAETADSFKRVAGFDGVEIRDLGLGALSGGALAGQVFRCAHPRTPLPGTWHMHDLAFQIGFITRGWGLYEFEGVGRLKLEAGASIFHLPRNRLRMLDCSDDFEGLWLKSSDRDRITAFIPDAATGAWSERTVVRELG